MIDLDAISRTVEQDRLWLPPYVHELLAEVGILRAQIKADEAGYDHVRAELKRAVARLSRANAIPVGVFFAPEDIIIVRNEHGGEVIGYRYEPLVGGS